MLNLRIVRYRMRIAQKPGLCVISGRCGIVSGPLPSSFENSQLDAIKRGNAFPDVIPRGYYQFTYDCPGIRNVYP